MDVDSVSCFGISLCMVTTFLLSVLFQGLYCALCINELITTFLKIVFTINMESQQQLNIIPIKFCLVAEKLLSFLNNFFDGVVQEQNQFH